MQQGAGKVLRSCRSALPALSHSAASAPCRERAGPFVTVVVVVAAAVVVCICSGTLPLQALSLPLHILLSPTTCACPLAVTGGELARSAFNRVVFNDFLCTDIAVCGMLLIISQGLSSDGNGCKLAASVNMITGCQTKCFYCGGGESGDCNEACPFM